MKWSQVFLALCLVGFVAAYPHPGPSKESSDSLTHDLPVAEGGRDTPDPGELPIPPDPQPTKFKAAAQKAGSAARKAGNSAIKGAGGRAKAARKAGNSAIKPGRRAKSAIKGAGRREKAAKKSSNSAIKGAGGREKTASSAPSLHTVYQQHKKTDAAAGAGGAVGRRALSDEELISLVARLLRNEDNLYTRGYYDFELNELD